MFSTSLSSVNEALPTPAWMMPAFFDAELDRTALGRLHRIGDVHGDGADFGVRHSYRAARAPYPDGRPAASYRGVAMQRSKSIEPLLTFSTRSSAPTTSAPAALASFRLGAAREYADPHGTAGAVRQVDHAAHHLVSMLGIDAEIHGDFDGFRRISP